MSAERSSRIGRILKGAVMVEGNSMGYINGLTKIASVITTGVAAKVYANPSPEALLSPRPFSALIATLATFAFGAMTYDSIVLLSRRQKAPKIKHVETKYQGEYAPKIETIQEVIKLAKKFSPPRRRSGDYYFPLEEFGADVFITTNISKGTVDIEDTHIAIFNRTTRGPETFANMGNLWISVMFDVAQVKFEREVFELSQEAISNISNIRDVDEKTKALEEIFDEASEEDLQRVLFVLRNLKREQGKKVT